MTRRERRVVALGALVIATAMAIRGGPLAGARVMTWKEGVEDRVALAAGYEIEISGAPALEEHAQAVRKAYDSLAPRLVPGTSHAQAVSEVVAMVRHLAEQNHVRVIEWGETDDTARAGVVQAVGIRMKLESDLAGLLSVLDAVESGRAVVGVRELELVAVPGSDTSSVEAIEAEVRLQAWRSAR